MDKGMLLHIEMLDICNPKVWRDIFIPSTLTFHQLHQVIQIAFDWEDEHLYDFENLSKRALSGFKNPVIIELLEDEMDSPFMMPSFGPKKKSVDSTKAVVSQYFLKPKDYMIYTYDFGDNWEHKVELIGFTDEPCTKIKCVDGAGLCPKEDCGGIGGWEMLKEAIKSPNDDNAEMLEWYFGSVRKARTLDLNKFNKAAVNRWLGKIEI